MSSENAIRPGFVAVLFCVVAVIATAVWLLRAPKSEIHAESQPPTPGIQAATSASAVGSGDSIPIDGEPNDAQAVAPQSGRRKIPSPPSRKKGESAESPSRIADVLAAIPVAVETRKGAGSVTGRVKTADGQPLADVKVTVTVQDRSAYRQQNHERKKDPSLEEVVADAVRNYRQNEANRRVATTDASGVYALGELADADYFIQAQADGYEITIPQRGARSSLVRPDATVDFVATAVIRVPVAVYLPGGALAPRAVITGERKTLHASSSTRAAWTLDEPSIPLTPGTFTLRAQGGEEDEMWSDKQKVSIKKGGPPAALAFQLRTKTAIKGRIITPADAQFPNYLQVYILKTQAGVKVDEERLRREGESRTLSSLDQRFRFDDLFAGVYLIGAGIGNGKVLVTETVNVAREAITTQDLFIGKLPVADMFVVWVRGPDGDLVEDVSFGVERRRGGSSSSGGTRATRRDDGAWLVEPHSWNEDDTEAVGVTNIVTAITGEYGQKTAEFTGTEREKIIQFGPVATVKVTLSGYAGCPAEGRMSLALQEPGKADERSLRGMQGGNTGAEGISSDGVAELGPVEAGNYEVVLSAMTDKWTRRPIGRQPVQLRAGENGMTMEIPPLYTVTVSFDQAVATVTLNSETGGRFGRGQAQRTVGKDRVVTFDNLPAGEYSIQAHGAISGTMTVSVPETVDVVFRPK